MLTWRELYSKALTAQTHHVNFTNSPDDAIKTGSKLKRLCLHMAVRKQQSYQLHKFITRKESMQCFEEKHTSVSYSLDIGIQVWLNTFGDSNWLRDRQLEPRGTASRKQHQNNDKNTIATHELSSWSTVYESTVSSWLHLIYLRKVSLTWRPRSFIRFSYEVSNYAGTALRPSWKIVWNIFDGTLFSAHNEKV